MNAIASLPASMAVLLAVNLDGDAGRVAAIAESPHLSFPRLADAKQSVGRVYRVDGPAAHVAGRSRWPGVCGAWAGDTNSMPELARQIKELQSQ